MSAVQPFIVPHHADEVAWVRSRVEAWRPFPAPEGAPPWFHGADMDYMQRLREHWLNAYDWGATVERLNRLPHVRVALGEGQPVLHAIHLRSPRADAVPLLIAHGWPGSVLEFEDLYAPLADPGNPGLPAFHVVAPSLPGYAWSDPPTAPIGPRAVASLYDELMPALGYSRYLYQGGDWGSVVGGWLGLESSRLIGLHLNGFGLRPADMTPTDDAGRRWMEWAQRIRLTETGYLQLQATKPQSLAFAMLDSPMGVAAWLAEKYCGWSDVPGGFADPPFPMDRLLDTIMVYLTTRSFHTATWLYRGMALEGGFTMPEGRRVEVPTSVAAFPRDLLAFPPRPMVERGYAVHRWTEMPRGGHFAGLEEPELLLDDLRGFAASLLPLESA